jgi:hypothetical protein
MFARFGCGRSLWIGSSWKSWCVKFIGSHSNGCGRCFVLMFRGWLGQVIGKARVPIIKFVETVSNIPFDIRYVRVH